MSMTVVATKAIKQTMSVTNTGPEITSLIEVRFTGMFDPVYIYQNATAMGLPDYGDYLTGTTSEMYVSSTNADINNGALWNGTTAQPGSFIYTAKFSTITAERLDLSPLSRPAVVTGGGIELTEVRRVDVTGAPIINSVGDYYEGLPDFYIPGSEISVTWNVASNPLSICQQFSFSTNQSAIWGQSAYSGVIGKMTAANVYEVYAGILIEYWKVTLPVRFRNDGRGWNYQPLDYGYRYIDSGTVKTYVDPTTNATGPVFLDGSGGLLNGDGTTDGSDAVIYPASSGSGPAGYKTLTSQDWTGISCPVNPFST